MIDLFFIDRNPRVIEAIKKAFEGRKSPQITFHFVCDDIFSLSGVDAYITAGNSYGVMSGGIDLAFRNFFGIRLQDAIQHEIFFHPSIVHKNGLQVGETVWVKTRLNDSITQIVYAPTMQKPEDISETNNVWLSFLAILGTIQHLSTESYKHSYVVACPGLGCLTGRMPYDKMADQMLQAWEYWQKDVYKSTKDETISKINV